MSEITWLQRYLDFCEQTMLGSKKFHTFCFLAGMSACLERRVWIDSGLVGHTYPNLYVFLTGPSGVGKTTHGDIIVDRILRQLSNPPFIASGTVTPASLLDEFVIAKSEFSVDEELFQQSALFAYSKELGVLLRDIGGGSLMMDLINLYDGVPEHTKRTKKHKLEKITAPLLSILGCSTSEFIRREIPQSSESFGLLARSVFVFEQGPLPELRDDPKPLDKEQKKELRSLIGFFETMRQVSGEVPMSQDYREAFAVQKEKIFKELARLSGISAHLASRERVLLKKVSLILAIMDGCDELKSSHLDKSIEILADSRADAIRTIGLRSRYRDPTFMNSILDAIPFQPNSITKTDLLQKFYGSGILVQSISEFRDCILSLRDTGLIIIREITGRGQVLTRVRNEYDQKGEENAEEKRPTE